MAGNKEASEHECEKIDINWENNQIHVPDSIEDIGGCSDGCCDDYKCKICGKTFRIEWPD